MPAKVRFLGTNADALRKRKQRQQRIVGQFPADDRQLDSETSSTRASSDTEMSEANVAALPPPPPPPPLPCDCGCDDILADSADASETSFSPEFACDCGCEAPLDSDDTDETSAFPPKYSILQKTFLALKLEVAQGRKDMGAQLFGQGRFDEALGKYNAVVDDISRAFPEELKPAADDLKRASYLNSAACFLKLGDHKLAGECCASVLYEEPFNEKALFRRALALIGLGMDTEALSDLQLLLEEHPSNAEARRLLPQVERRVHQIQRKAQRKKKVHEKVKLR